MHLADQGRDIASGYGVVADISGYDFRSQLYVVYAGRCVAHRSRPVMARSPSQAAGKPGV
jgi:hypothetical protein